MLEHVVASRSDKVDNNGGIVVRGTSANVLVENSVIKVPLPPSIS